MAERIRSVLDREPLTYDIAAEVAGKPWAPTVGQTTFEGAYLATPLVRPGVSDWKTGSLETTSIGTVRGLVMLGPAAANGNTLATGTWYEWIRLTDPPTGVQVVKMVGTVTIQ